MHLVKYLKKKYCINTINFMYKKKHCMFASGSLLKFWLRPNKAVIKGPKKPQSCTFHPFLVPRDECICEDRLLLTSCWLHSSHLPVREWFGLLDSAALQWGRLMYPNTARPCVPGAGECCPWWCRAGQPTPLPAALHTPPVRLVERDGRGRGDR